MSIERIFNEREERARVRGIYWGVVIILAGLVFGASGLDFLPEIGSAGAWTFVMVGAGLVGTLMNIYYASSSDTPNPTSWDWIWSGFWLVVGIGDFFAIDMFWPLAMIIMGVLALITAMRKD